jgi:hypothetical protein
MTTQDPPTDTSWIEMEHPRRQPRRRRPLLQRILRLFGTDWCGNHYPPYPPTLHSYEVYGPPDATGKPTSVRTRYYVGREYPDHIKQAERHGLVRVFDTWPGDGHELWLGYPSAWQFHMDMRTALRLAWWILWTWWAKCHWFGLRRWIYYKALSAQIRSYERAGKD